MDTSQSIPLSLAAFLGIICGALFLWSAFKQRNWRGWSLFAFGFAILLVSFFFILALNPWIGDVRFRAFRALYGDLELGMTRAEVFATIHQHYPEEGLRGKPTLNSDQGDHLIIFMNTEDGSHTCEGIIVDLHHDVVTKVSYSCD